MFLCLPVGPQSIRPKRTLSGDVLFSRPCFEYRVCRRLNCPGGGESNHETTDVSWHCNDCMTHSLVLASKSLPWKHGIHPIGIQFSGFCRSSSCRLRTDTVIHAKQGLV
jgi:hypothetical protein